MEGMFLRNLFTLQARTRNPFYLFLMFVFGVIPLAVLLVLMAGDISSLSSLSLATLIYFLVFILVTGAVTINFLLSILETLRIIPSRKQLGNLGLKEGTKEFPKR